MNVHFSDAVILFKAMGVKAESWSKTRMEQKISTLQKFVTEAKVDKNKFPASVRENFEDVMAALEAGRAVRVVDNVEENGKGKEEDPPATHAKKLPAPAVEEDGGDDETEEEEPKPKKKEGGKVKGKEKEAPSKGKDKAGKDAKTKPDAGKAPAKQPKGAPARDGKGNGKAAPAKKREAPKRAGGDGRPGVVMSIIEFLAKATAKKALSKKEVLDKLCERFPDRERDSMLSTVNSHVPSWIYRTKGVVITPVETKEGKKYFIDPEQTAMRKLLAKSEGVPAKAKGKKPKEDDEEEEAPKKKKGKKVVGKK